MRGLGREGTHWGRWKSRPGTTTTRMGHFKGKRTLRRVGYSCKKENGCWRTSANTKQCICVWAHREAPLKVVEGAGNSSAIPWRATVGKEPTRTALRVTKYFPASWNSIRDRLGPPPVWASAGHRSLSLNDTRWPRQEAGGGSSSHISSACASQPSSRLLPVIIDPGLLCLTDLFGNIEFGSRQSFSSVRVVHQQTSRQRCPPSTPNTSSLGIPPINQWSGSV